MKCPDSAGFWISTAVRADDGTIYHNTRRPPCEKWTCPACRARRAKHAASHLLRVAGPGARLWVAQVPAAERRMVERLFRARDGKGRMVLGQGEVHLHVADVDCLSRQRGATPWRVTTAGACDVARALCDPLTPITRGPRWVGTWREIKEPTAELLLVMQFTSNDDRSAFCHAFDLDPAELRGARAGVDQERVAYLEGAWEWWRVNMRGKQPRPDVPQIEPRY